VKAVYLTPGDQRGLVGGPWIRNGTGCTAPPTVPPTVAPPPTVTPPASTVPPVTPSTPSTPSAPRKPAVPVKPPTGSSSPPAVNGGIPATGVETYAELVAAAVLLAAGVALLILRARKPVTP
jgi:hypothetical protein